MSLESQPRLWIYRRYGKDKEEITGISHEPWHFRYVGYPHSKIMQENGFSLEEYTQFIKAYLEDKKYLLSRLTELRLKYIMFLQKTTKR